MKHIKRLNINYILFIISYLTFYANCYSCEDDCKRVDNDCVFKSAYLTGDWCLTNCRPNLYNKDSEKCYTCNNNNGQYFYFNYEITERCGRLTRLCTVNTYHTKTIYGTNQCVTSCGSHYYEWEHIALLIALVVIEKKLIHQLNNVNVDIYII